MRLLSTVGAVAATLALAACATPTTDRPTVTTAESVAEGQKQAELARTLRREEKARVAAVAERLFTANVDLCPQTHRSLGLRADVAEAFEKPGRPAGAPRSPPTCGRGWTGWVRAVRPRRRG